MPDLQLPEENSAGQMVFGTNRSRLALAMDRATTPEDSPTFQESPASLVKYQQSPGIDNPYGSGVHAYEPHTVLFDDYSEAYGRVQQSKAEEAAKAQTFTTVEADPGSPMTNATGQLGAAINAAMELANRRVPYVWGGTTRNGVDCSGLIYYAFRSAGIKLDGKDWPRLRAVDYGKLGQSVSAQDARPGDLVYFDNPGDVDHIGIYLGNGKMIQAPQTGDVVRVTNVGKATSYRRVIADDAFTPIATPEGGSYWSYGGTAQPWAAAPAAAPRSNAAIARTSPWRQGQFA